MTVIRISPSSSTDHRILSPGWMSNWSRISEGTVTAPRSSRRRASRLPFPTYELDQVNLMRHLMRKRRPGGLTSSPREHHRRGRELTSVPGARTLPSYERLRTSERDSPVNAEIVGCPAVRPERSTPPTETLGHTRSLERDGPPLNETRPYKP